MTYEARPLSELLDKLKEEYPELYAKAEEYGLVQKKWVKEIRLRARRDTLLEVIPFVKFFLKAIRENSWQGNDWNGGDIQDTAESLGLITVVPYDPEKHGEADGMFEEGDSYYELTDFVKELERMAEE